MRPAPAATAPSTVRLDVGLLDGLGGPVGIAVSGGGDSVALAVLMAKARPGVADVILTVDHGLRADGAAEADAVEALGRRLGRPVVRLKVEGPPRGSLQAWARQARYSTLAAAASAHGLAGIATGHTLDDQAETVLLRLARGSGLRGLAAMRPRTELYGVPVVRPLLATRRDALREALSAQKVGWLEDPSNGDPRFDRVAMRTLAPRLAAVGLTAERLAAVAGHLARASDLVDALTADLLAEAMRVDRAGAVVLDTNRWAAAHPEVRLRALAEAARRAGGHAPRFAALASAEAALLAGAPATLGHACAAVLGARIVLWREARAIAPLALAAGGRGVFDGRYEVAAGPHAVVVAALGDRLPLPPPNDVHRPAVATAPGLFVDGALVAAPTFGLRAKAWASQWAILSPVR
ncbi:tRNA lysidine(34) synthetase TilS [Acuticoccus sp.]|uniref:tRNA lysidine(34) synthetase TilS n=1 Tax=Acuticoccus sp. TaxID=1904378 RepID=UPI003B51603B